MGHLWDFFILKKGHHPYRCKVNWTLAEEYARQKLSPEARMADRFCRLCHQEQPIIFDGQQIVFIRTVSNLPEIFTPAEWEQLKAKHYIHELGFLSNICPDYALILSTGLLQLRSSTDRYGRAAIDSLIELSDKYLEKAKQLRRWDLVDILTQVPRYPARSFREALQFFRIIHFGLWLEGNYHNNIGRFDSYMYPYFKKDLESGHLSLSAARELLEEFFLTFNIDSDLYPGVQQGDNGQSMMLGGVDIYGNDCFTRLSELCLQVSKTNGLIDPKINLRVSKHTPLDRFIQATELTKAGLGFPQYSNDDVVIPGLEKLGYPHADAVNYTVAACWEFIIPGVGADVPNIGALSLPKVVDIALHKSLLSSQSFEDFFGYVKEILRQQCDKICDGIRDLWFVPSPFLNAISGNAVHTGSKYNNFGIHGTGIATAVDSLAVIKKYVFEEGSIRKETLLRAVDSDFKEYPALLHTLRYQAPKLGNNDDYVDSIAVSLLESFAEALSGKQNCRGGIFRPGTGSAMYYLWHADEIGASPDGRHAGEPFGTNYSVSLFARVKGPVSVIGSMTKPNLSQVINGGPLTIELHSSVFQQSNDTEKVAHLVKSYIDLGGHQLQLNTVNTETLLDAQKNPQMYRQLVVRIWGWSAYFVELDKAYQEHVIARQAYRL